MPLPTHPILFNAPSYDIFQEFQRVIQAVEHFWIASHEIPYVVELLCLLVTITFAFLGCLGIC